MDNRPEFFEKVSSLKTEALFIGLAVLFLLLFAWAVSATFYPICSALYFLAFAFFLFYVFNYRTLAIRLGEKALQLKFGIFHWTIPLNDIETCFLDPTSLWRIGGAGIHFTWLGGRYRAMFNFLEHPRVVIALKQKCGPVRDIAFSTRQPDEFIRMLQQHIASLADEKGEST